MSKFEPQPGIMDIEPYKGGASHIPGMTDVLKLSSNENPFGPPLSAVAAARQAFEEMHRYPPTDHASLRAAIGEVHGLDPKRIICGVGSDELIHLLCQCYAGPGTEVLYTEHGFSIYRITTLAAGAAPVSVKETERQVEVDAVLAGITPLTRIVFLTNPGNPTCALIPPAELERLADGIPEDCLLVLDGAYAEFADGFDGGASLVGTHANVVMLRTFSKIYGLGGMRVGWGYASAEVIDVLNRVRGPFNLSVPALAAAEAAVLDRDWVAMCQSENARLRAWLREELGQLGLPSDESYTNFILPRFASQAEAEACEAHLRSKGILVRKVAGYGLPEALRITIGTEADCYRVRDAIAEFVEAS
ncbi:histidinol-phosphate transaminase [Pelagovum pacificum]|uniref:Histidinol-phosphate aminotransferase n=1 Tax=Pelagovum pacificum TaxID=2588711 RepID=A0A5C5G8X1_9RHOB|nr:histidinol-phosphate transaminase [Pelagovum pacificum]QQA42083.1 histidinol-phosphate transaminase [Pelagovum pacificum]TNY31171.1 histidinol-phosphate transaminase [Pelagovum pacificum]